MDDKLVVDSYTLGDGRRAERRIKEVTKDGVVEKIVELHVEAERPLRLQERIVETSKPVVVERKLEKIDPATGNVVEKKVEALEPKTPMQVVEHIGFTQKPGCDCHGCDCNVTKQDMIDAIIAALQTKNDVSAQSVPSELSNGLASLGVVDKIAPTVKQGMSTMDKVLMGIVAAQIAALVYLIFFM